MIKLAQATLIIDNALGYAGAKGLQPLTVAVLDTTGCLVALERKDGMSLLRPQISQAKAWGALGMGMGTQALAQRAASHPAFINSLAAQSGGRLVPIAGIEAAGFEADTGGQQAP
jgi:uncharacterized protein GlcG (DUF336 family)